MATLKNTTINGNLNVNNDINLNNNSCIMSTHPNSGELSNMLSMDSNGNTIVGYDGYVNKNGDTHIYGNDVNVHVSSTEEPTSYCPYYKIGDTISFRVRTSGYVTNSKKDVHFTIPITKPVIGNPSAIAESEKGFVLRQNNTYTHGSNGASSPVVYVKPLTYFVEKNYNGGFIVKAEFDETAAAINTINNNPIGVYWDGTITLI